MSEVEKLGPKQVTVYSEEVPGAESEGGLMASACPTEGLQVEKGKKAVDPPRGSDSSTQLDRVHSAGPASLRVRLWPPWPRVLKDPLLAGVFSGRLTLPQALKPTQHIVLPPNQPPIEISWLKQKFATSGPMAFSRGPRMLGVPVPALPT